MAITETDVESGEEEEDGNKSQKEQEEELQKAKKKQVLFLLSVMCMRWKSFLNMDIGISAIYFGSNIKQCSNCLSGDIKMGGS